MAPSSNKLRAQFPPGVDGARREVLRRSTTYLARIAIILQDAPDKMLTFMQLMDRMGPLVRHDRKSIENNIRVCLSTNKCFVKIPLVPDSLGSKRNFWKLELSLITTKMVRRHFKDIMDFFPELSSRREDGGGTSPPPPPSVQISCEVKFNGPFSIESLLKRDSPAPTRTSTHEACVSIHSEHDHLDYTTPHAQKRCLDWDAEHLIPGHYRSSVICPQEGSTFNTTSKRLCIGPPFPIYSVTSFNETYVQYPNYDPRHFRL